MNDISLTVRLPSQLNDQLTKLAKEIGMTKTNLIRIAIHEFLPNYHHTLDFQNSEKKSRLVLNVNQLTFDILDKVAKEYDQSINSVVTAASFLALERFSKWL